MAVGLVMHFSDLTSDHYDTVMTTLGLSADAGDWPDGLISHAAGATPDGWCVIDVWESQEQADAFIGGRLRLAFEQVGGLPQPQVTPVRIHLLHGHGRRLVPTVLR